MAEASRLEVPDDLQEATGLSEQEVDPELDPEVEKKLMAEWFLIDRWTGSSAFYLPQEARGVYREMLTQAWRRRARLPNDHEAIRRVTATTEAEWERSWPQIAKYWRVDGKWLVNDTQLEVYAVSLARAIAVHKKAMAAAAASPQVKRKLEREANLKVGPEVNFGVTPPSPSPSPSPSPENGNSSAAHAQRMLETQRSEYCRIVWEEVAAVTGWPKTRLMSSHDYQICDEWIKGGIPVRIVLRAVQDMKARASSARSLSYFAPAVKEAYGRWRHALQVTT